MSKIELHLGDCLEILPTLAADSVDAVITDPPYPKLTGGYDRMWTSGVSPSLNTTPTIGEPWQISDEWLAHAWRISRLGLIIFCSYHWIDGITQKLSSAKRMGLLTWYKRNAPPTGKNVPRHTTEFIWLLSKKPGLKWDSFKNTMIDIPKPQAGCFATERILQPGNGKALHPTQKPLKLMKLLLGVEPESVLDPFMGTGTTGVACVQTGGNFIGIEIEPKYFKIAEKRIAEAQLQLRFDM